MTEKTRAVPLLGAEGAKALFEVIRSLMVREGLTQHELGKRLKMRQPAVSKLLRRASRGRLRSGTLVRIAGSLGVRTETLLPDTDSQAPTLSQVRQAFQRDQFVEAEVFTLMTLGCWARHRNRYLDAARFFCDAKETLEKEHKRQRSLGNGLAFERSLLGQLRVRARELEEASEE